VQAHILVHIGIEVIEIKIDIDHALPVSPVYFTREDRAEVLTTSLSPSEPDPSCSSSSSLGAFLRFDAALLADSAVMASILPLRADMLLTGLYVLIYLIFYRQIRRCIHLSQNSACT
jgi:hypothetical protein